MSPSPARPSGGPTARALGAAALAAIAAVWWLRPEGHRWLIGVEALARWALIPAGPLACWAARRREWPAAVLAGSAALGQLAATAGARGGGRPDRCTGRGLRLLTANLLLDNPRPDAVAVELRRADVDLLALQELTPGHLERFRAAGLLDDFPHQLLDPDPRYHGSGILSRLPLSDGEVIDLDGRPMTAATVQTPDDAFRLVCVHAVNPAAPGERERWQRQLDLLGRIAAATGLPVVLAGDFNATLDHAAFRRLLRTGLRDCYAVAGRGVGGTWPRWRGPVPPLIQIDHVLISPGIAVAAIRAERTVGSDHDRLVADLCLPLAAAEAFRTASGGARASRWRPGRNGLSGRPGR